MSHGLERILRRWLADRQLVLSQAVEFATKCENPRIREMTVCSLVSLIARMDNGHKVCLKSFRLFESGIRRRVKDPKIIDTFLHQSGLDHFL